MAALQRAFALAQMDHVAMLIAQHLKLDVARALDQLFHVNVGAAESLLGFRSGGLKRGDQFSLRCAQCACRARHRLRQL